MKVWQGMVCWAAIAACCTVFYYEGENPAFGFAFLAGFSIARLLELCRDCLDIRKP